MCPIKLKTGLLTVLLMVAYAVTANEGKPADWKLIPGDNKTEVDVWHETMLNASHNQHGCFSAQYPGEKWIKVECGKAPAIPNLPAAKPRKETIGNGTDYSLTANSLSHITGGFTVTKGGAGQSGDSFSVQMNSQFLQDSPACDSSSCLAWQQFVYVNSTDNSYVFMQYWLIGYGSGCPSGWESNGNNCYKNSPATKVPLQKLSVLSSVRLTGAAISGQHDEVVLRVGTSLYKASNSVNEVSLAGNWKVAEFNVFGDYDSHELEFQSGTEIQVTMIPDAHDISYTKEGFTAETSNLSLKGKPSVYIPHKSSICVAGPCSASMTFIQSN